MVMVPIPSVGPDPLPSQNSKRTGTLFPTRAVISGPKASAALPRVAAVVVSPAVPGVRLSIRSALPWSPRAGECCLVSVTIGDLLDRSTRAPVLGDLMAVVRRPIL
jgi:hypothetical protein